jgi:hypothetical protein
VWSFIVSGLYRDTRAQAVSESTVAFGRSHGLSDSQVAALQADVTRKVLALSEPLHLDPHELRDINTIVMAHAIDVASGKPTGEKTDRWADEALADLKTRHMSMKRVNQVIFDCNEWLKAEHPAVHAALKNSAHLGNHPQLVRKLTDRFLARESEQARKGRAATYVGQARGDASDSIKVPPGGLLAGNVDAQFAGADDAA